MGELKQFTITQLMAMYLGKLKTITSNELNNAPVSYVVVAVPGWYRDSQRRAILDACELAGLNCLRLMNETTATALGYGITKTDLPEEDPRNILIVDIGHSSYSVAAVSYIKGQLTIKATSYDKHVGGRYIDDLLVKHFSKIFQEKYNLDILSNRKATFRLRTACEKAKKILSANLQAPLSVESVMNDMDVSALISREEFESMIQEQIEKLSAPLSRVLEQTGWTMDQIYSIEVVGGSSRIPAFKNKLKELLDKELSFTLNQDEAIARGCALQCAILSPVFKVRDFSVNDINHYPIKFQWKSASDPNKISDLEVFPRNQSLPCTKILTFYRKEEFAIEAHYNLPKNSSQISSYIGSFVIKNVKPNKKDENELSTVKVKARMNIHGIVSLEQAYAVVEEEDSKPEKEKVDEENKEKDSSSKKIKKFELNFESKTTSLSPNVISELKEQELNMHLSDKLVMETELAKNNLEEYIYDQRSKAGDEAYSKYINPKDLPDYQNKLNEFEDWLYNEGDDAPKSQYIEKLNILKNIGDNMINLFRENEQRPKSVQQLKDIINSNIKLIEDTLSNTRTVHIPTSKKKV